MNDVRGDDATPPAGERGDRSEPVSARWPSQPAQLSLFGGGDGETTLPSRPQRGAPLPGQLGLPFLDPTPAPGDAGTGPGAATTAEPVVANTPGRAASSAHANAPGHATASVASEHAAAAPQAASVPSARLAKAARMNSFYLELEQFSSLEALKVFAEGCDRCGLRQGCKGVVFGEGDPHAAVMLVGEGPGATEDELGRPFVGRAGQLLDDILKAAGFRREDVFITNVVMCRPPGNRTPENEEMAACRPYLERKLDLIDPKIVVAMGATAARALIDPRARITKLRGQWQEVGGRRIMPTFHPAALLRDPSKKPAAWSDFKQVRDAYRELKKKRLA